VSTLLVQKTVLLRIQAGSTEAGQLGQFCKLESIPTLVVIHNGRLVLQLESDATQNDFINALRKIFGANPIPITSPAQASTPPATTPDPPRAQAIAANEHDDLYGSPPPTAKAKGKQKATAAPASNTVTPSVTAVQQAARDALRKKKRDEAEELARVKARIEADRVERKAQAEARKVERERERNKEVQSQSQSQTTTSTRGSQAKTVNLQVRLFDGATIRSSFPRTATLQGEVRKWVDEEFGKLAADDPNVNNKQLPPYFFRHILAPQPSRELSAGDESQSLGDIDLAPSATLVLVPVKGYTEAYSASGGGVVGTATGLVGGAFGLLSSTVGFVGSTLGSVFGSAPAAEAPGQATGGGSAPQQPASSDAAAIRVRTLADQRAREPTNQQFYNGNQVSILSNVLRVYWADFTSSLILSRTTTTATIDGDEICS
jgi:hypothetical protein